MGKYPSVNTLSKLVLPHAPSPMMTNFLDNIHLLVAMLKLMPAQLKDGFADGDEYE